MRRRLSLALLAALLLPLAPGTASSGSFAPAVLALADDADRTVALPLGMPLPTGSVGLGPGTYLLSDIDGQTFLCSANWVWAAGGAYYLGAAGHCFLPEGATSTHGPDRDHDASGVAVRACVRNCEFSGGLDFALGGTTVALGPVVYARQTKNGADIGNDFGLVRIPDHLIGEIRAAMPVWGRAAGGTKDVSPGDVTCLYGNGLAVGEAYLTKARMGTGIVSLADGSWRAAMPSLMGDSGAAVATCRATLGSVDADRAVGVLTHLSGSGIAGTSMGKAQQLAREAGLSIAPIL